MFIWEGTYGPEGCQTNFYYFAHFSSQKLLQLDAGIFKLINTSIAWPIFSTMPSMI